MREGRYLAYVDVATGGVIAVRQLNTYATGTVLYHVRRSLSARTRPHRRAAAPRARVTVNGAAADDEHDRRRDVVADGDGNRRQTSIDGDLVTVVNKADGNALATATLALAPGGALVWDASGNGRGRRAGQHVHRRPTSPRNTCARTSTPTMPTIDDQMIANVNIATGLQRVLRRQGDQLLPGERRCARTPALLQDVVFHEYGHRVHTAEIIEGVGDFDGAMSEGAADFLAASITGDHGMGRGFFYTDDAAARARSRR